MVLALLAAAPAARALEPALTLTQYGHESWSTDDGLPKNAVSDILQTRDGYLWVATEGGLARFDGVRFTTFSAPENGSPPGAVFSRLFEDRDGVLWISTMGGGLVRYEGGRFATLTTHEGLPSDRLVGMAQARDGALWIATAEAGLIRYKDGAFSSPVTTREGLTSNSVRDLFVDREGDLWVATTGGGLDRIRNGRVTAIRKADGLLSDTVTCVTQDHFGNLWIGTPEGLNRYRDGLIVSYTAKDGMKGDYVLRLREDGRGQLWIGTYDGGLNRFSEGKFTAMTAKDGLSNDLVFALAEDREGSFWVGTSGGLDHLHDGKVTVFTSREGLADDLAWSAAPGREGAVWIGTRSGLSRLSGGRFQNFLAGELVWSVLEDRDGILWAGTRRGLFRYDGTRFRRYTTADGLSSDQVVALAQGRDGTLWVGTEGGGVNRLEAGKFTAITTRDGLAGDTILYLHEDRLGRLWICSRGGVDVLKDGRLERQDFDALCVYEEGDGTLWFGTFGKGILRISGGRRGKVTAKEGLPDDVVFSILPDGSGSVWMGSGRGISRARLSDLRAIAEGRQSSLQGMTLGKADGLRSVTCAGGCQPSACRTLDGLFWFPTMRGVVRLDPARLSFNPTPPPVILEEVRVGRKPVPLGGELVLGPRGGEIEFRYTALSLPVPQRVLFKVKLEGYDEDWVPMGTQRTAVYTHLPAGRYVFRAIACNNDGLWNTAGTSLAVVLKPHFYNTSWFYALVGLLGTLAAYGIYELRVRGLKARERTLVRLVGERTGELQAAKAALEERSRQLEEANVLLTELSYRDPVTGAPNRRHFGEVLESEWRRAARSGAPLGLLMADLDFFKAFNDTYGHPAGDECLKRIADALQEGIRRAGEVLARYGGEEFAVILPDATLEQAAALAEDLRRRVEALGIPHSGVPVAPVVTISFGAASLIPREGTLPGNLLDAADRALYRAKQLGRNRVEAGTP